MRNLTIIVALLLSAWSCNKESSSLQSNGVGTSGSITRFAISGNYMYALDLNKILTYDISDADKPKLVNQIETDYGLETITIYDGTIYLGSRAFLYILGLDNPAAPVILSQTEREFEGLSTGCDPVVVKGNYAYSTVKIIANICGRTSSTSALVVYDVSDKTNPVPLISYDLEIPNGLAIKDNYLFVCDEGVDKVLVFDITTPDNPTPTNFSFGLLDPVDLIANGEKMIISSKTNFEIYDISDIINIKKVASIAK